MNRKNIFIAILVPLAICLILTGTDLAMSSANYSFPWSSLSGGGGFGNSTGYRLGYSIGQPVTGFSQTTGYRLGSGFWAAFGGGAPSGVLLGDATGEGVIDAVDITKVERIIAGLDVQTLGADANSDSNVNALDITKVERIIAELE